MLLLLAKISCIKTLNYFFMAHNVHIMTQMWKVLLLYCTHKFIFSAICWLSVVLLARQQFFFRIKKKMFSFLTDSCIILCAHTLTNLDTRSAPSKVHIHVPKMCQSLGRYSAWAQSSYNLGASGILHTILLFFCVFHELSAIVLDHTGNSTVYGILFGPNVFMLCIFILWYLSQQTSWLTVSRVFADLILLLKMISPSLSPCVFFLSQTGGKPTEVLWERVSWLCLLFI